MTVRFLVGVVRPPPDNILRRLDAVHAPLSGPSHGPGWVGLPPRAILTNLRTLTLLRGRIAADRGEQVHVATSGHSTLSYAVLGRALAHALDQGLDVADAVGTATMAPRGIAHQTRGVVDDEHPLEPCLVAAAHRLRRTDAAFL